MKWNSKWSAGIFDSQILITKRGAEWELCFAQIKREWKGDGAVGGEKIKEESRKKWEILSQLGNSVVLMAQKV